MMPSFSENWMDYSNQFGTHETIYGHDPLLPNSTLTFVDFANQELGGDWRGDHGNVQEEQMVQQSPELAMILAINNPHRGSGKLWTRTGGDTAHPNSSNPLLITGLRFLQPQSDAQAKDSRIKTDLTFDPRKGFNKKLDAPPVNVLAIAAPKANS